MYVSLSIIGELISKLKFHSFDCVIGVSRGGLVPATWISHALDKPLYTVNLKSYNDKQQDKIIWNQKFDLKKQTKNKNILIVDDICDTGNTLVELVHKFPKANNIKIAVLVDKQQTILDCIHIITGKKDVWYVFPWEL